MGSYTILTPLKMPRTKSPRKGGRRRIRPGVKPRSTLRRTTRLPPNPTRRKVPLRWSSSHTPLKKSENLQIWRKRVRQKRRPGDKRSTTRVDRLLPPTKLPASWIQYKKTAALVLFFNIEYSYVLFFAPTGQGDKLEMCMRRTCSFSFAVFIQNSNLTLWWILSNQLEALYVMLCLGKRFYVWGSAFSPSLPMELFMCVLLKSACLSNYSNRVYAKTKKEASKRSFERFVRRSFHFIGSFKLQKSVKLPN